MTADQVAPAVTDCPLWCGVNHQTGSLYHAHLVGEVRLREGSVVLVVTQRGDTAGVEVAYHAAGMTPAVAFLGAAATRRLRNSLNAALGDLDAA